MRVEACALVGDRWDRSDRSGEALRHYHMDGRREGPSAKASRCTACAARHIGSIWGQWRTSKTMEIIPRGYVLRVGVFGCLHGDGRASAKRPSDRVAGSPAARALGGSMPVNVLRHYHSRWMRCWVAVRPQAWGGRTAAGFEDCD